MPDSPSARSSPPAPRKPDPNGPQPWRVEGGRDGQDGGQGGGGFGGGGRRFRFPRWLLWLSLGLLVLNFIFASQVPDKGGRITVPYSFFRSEVQKGNVSEVNAQGDIIQGSFKKETQPADHPDGQDPNEKFETTRPTFATDDELLKLLIDNKVEVNAEPVDQGRSLLADILLFFGPTLLLVGLFVLLMRRAGGG